MVKNYHNERNIGHDALQTQQIRSQADSLLQRLIEGRAESERRFAETGQRDAMKFVTGRTALDEAIATTRGMIREMDQMLEQMNADLGEGAAEERTLAVGACQ